MNRWAIVFRPAGLEQTAPLLNAQKTSPVGQTGNSSKCSCNFVRRCITSSLNCSSIMGAMYRITAEVVNEFSAIALAGVCHVSGYGARDCDSISAEALPGVVSSRCKEKSHLEQKNFHHGGY
jgi:hypothetical protein